MRPVLLFLTFAAFFQAIMFPLISVTLTTLQRAALAAISGCVFIFLYISASMLFWILLALLTMAWLRISDALRAIGGAVFALFSSFASTCRMATNNENTALVELDQVSHHVGSRVATYQDRAQRTTPRTVTSCKLHPKIWHFIGLNSYKAK